MNKEFSYYMNNINEAIEEDENLKIVFDKHKDEILIRIKEHYEKYKDVYKFDDLLNINSKHCTIGNSICCNDCYCCIYCILCSDCRECELCYNCSNCKNCRWCYNSKNCDHCRGCEHCENCRWCYNSKNCDHCGGCEHCENCDHLENCDSYLENYEYKSEDDSEDD